MAHWLSKMLLYALPGPAQVTAKDSHCAHLSPIDQACDELKASDNLVDVVRSPKSWVFGSHNTHSTQIVAEYIAQFESAWKMIQPDISAVNYENKWLSIHDAALDDFQW